jgi:predicted naringenin-chalcone synthase
MPAQILSIATSFPPLSANVEVATAQAQRMSCQDDDQAKMLAKLYRRTGIQARGSVLLETTGQGQIDQSFYPPLTDNGELGPSMQTRNERFAVEAPVLGTNAAKNSLTQCGVQADQITHLVTVTCTGFSAPGLDIELIRNLGLPATTQRVAVGFMGCHGLINGLRVARGLVAGEPNAQVLVTSVELCSLHYQYGYDAQRIVSGAIFADGAASLVVAHQASPKRTPSVADIVATGSCLVPDSTDSMTWKIGDHGFMMTLEASVPHLIEVHLKEYLTDWLDQQGEKIESIGGWAVHPGGSRILQAVETALELPADALDIPRAVLRDHGNMSSATLGAIMARFVDQQIPKPWLMLGFGPGLEIEVALLR